MSKKKLNINKITKLLEAARKKDAMTELQLTQQELIAQLALERKRADVVIALDREYKPIAIKANNKLFSEATAFAIASDWHFEEKVEPATVNYKNQYNLQIAERSAINFFANAVKLFKISSRDVPIKNFVLGLLGDLMSGYIHDELIEDNQLSPTQTVIKLHDILCSGINYLLYETKCNLIIVCKIGNHSRTTTKKKYATAYKNSYEWLLYHFVAREFKYNSRVTFVIENSYHTYLPVYDYVIRLHHGDYVLYQGGIGGITIPINKAIAQWDKERKADLDVFGHFHQLQLDTGSFKYICNGSNIGYSAFSISIKAGYEEPKQAFFIIDKKRFKTLSAPIIVR
jgi:hypothetical protein